MKTKDTSLLQSFEEYTKKIGEDQDRAMSAFKKRIYIDDMNTYLRAKTKQVIDVGIGSLDSKVMIVFEEKDKDHIAFYRDWMLTKGMKISDIYVTYLKKGPGDFPEDYRLVLQREASLFKNDCLIVNHTKEHFEGYVKTLNNEEFKKMLSLIDKEDHTEQEKQELVFLKGKYWKNVREILNYKIF